MNLQNQPDGITMLAKTLGASIRNVNHRDPNVFLREGAGSTDSIEPLVLRQCIRFKCSGMKAEIKSNGLYLVLQVKSQIVSGTWSVNVGDQIMLTRRLPESVQSFPLFALSSGLTFKARDITSQRSFTDLLREIELGPLESLNFYDNALTYYARSRESTQFLQNTRHVCRFASEISQATDKSQSFDLPAQFHDLRAIAQRWAISDDVEREEALESASPEELRMLVNLVSPRLPSISVHLKAHTGEREVYLDSLAQSAVEAQLALGSPAHQIS
jgi:hypothetical protein